MVGDAAADVQAARAAGLRAGLLFDARRCELCPLRGGGAGQEPPPDLSAARFDQIVRAILEHPSPRIE
jgi:D-glycero-D-manno-heptose 1,7-bisphosphate phosphatase